MNSAAIQAQEEERFEYQTTPFVLVKLFPRIQDSAAFIARLKLNCHLYTKDARIPHERISYFNKVRFNGSDLDYYLLEYDWNGGWGANVLFPWKNQLIFDREGKLVWLMNALKFRLLKIFPHEDPFLVTTISTAHGNGGHEIWKVENGKLKNVFGGFKGNRPQTYGTENNEPAEMTMSFKDDNRDGYNDVIFAGRIRNLPALAEGGALLIPVRFIFLYHPDLKKFIEKENYSKKYASIYGDTID